MNSFSRLRAKRIEGGDGQVSEAVEITQQINNAASDRIPDDVWATIQACGREGVERLKEELKPHNFSTLAAKDKRALMIFAIERAYGKADPGVKRSVQVQLSATGNDAVRQSLDALGSKLTLPEYANAAHSPADSDETEENDPEYPPDHLDH